MSLLSGSTREGEPDRLGELAICPEIKEDVTTKEANIEALQTSLLLRESGARLQDPSLGLRV